MSTKDNNDNSTQKTKASNMPAVLLTITLCAGIFVWQEQKMMEVIHTSEATAQMMERTQEAAIAAQATRELETYGQYSPGRYCIISATPDITPDKMRRMVDICATRHHEYISELRGMTASSTTTGN